MKSRHSFLALFLFLVCVGCNPKLPDGGSFDTTCYLSTPFYLKKATPSGNLTLNVNWTVTTAGGGGTIQIYSMGSTVKNYMSMMITDNFAIPVTVPSNGAAFTIKVTIKSQSCVSGLVSGMMCPGMSVASKPTYEVSKYFTSTIGLSIGGFTLKSFICC